MDWRRCWRRNRRLGLVLVAVLAGLAALNFWPGGVMGSAEAPACDDASVVRSVVNIFNTHPDYVGRSSTVMTGLAELREVEYRRHPDVNASANTRWCEGRGHFANGEAETEALTRMFFICS